MNWNLLAKNNSTILKTGISLLLVWQLSHCVQAQPDKVASLDKYVKRYIQKGQFEGAVVVAENYNILYSSYSGYGNLEKQTPITSNSAFYLGSYAKNFTADAIFWLYQNQKLALDDDIKKYFPELKYQNIKIYHLLANCSGIPSFEELLEMPEGKSNLLSNSSIATLIQKYGLKASFKPGEKWFSSSTNYVLLSLIVEQVSGQKFADFIQSNLFDPLEMKNSFFYTPASISNPNRTRGYRVNLIGKTSIDDLTYIDGVYGIGGIFASAEDVLKWEQAKAENKLIQATTLETYFNLLDANINHDIHYNVGAATFSTIVDKYELQWDLMVYQSYVPTLYGFKTIIDKDAANKRNIIVFNNTGCPYVYELQAGIKNILNGKEFTYPPLSIAAVMGKSIIKQDIESAIKEYYLLKEKAPSDYNFEEPQLRLLANTLADAKRITDAIEVLKLNATIYPESYLNYDKLGELYTKVAIQFYEKSIQLHPENFDSVEFLKKLKGEE